jgi:hypothetical protein
MQSMLAAFAEARGDGDYAEPKQHMDPSAKVSNGGQEKQRQDCQIEPRLPVY